MPQIAPDFPTQGETPWGDKMNTALQEIVDQSNANDQSITDLNTFYPPWVGTQAAYDALGTYDATRFYIITP